MEMENGQNNKIFTRSFLKQAREISSTDARPVSLKKFLLLAVTRMATLERNFQEQIDELKGVKK
jgi:hypothetical protein